MPKGIRNEDTTTEVVSKSDTLTLVEPVAISDIGFRTGRNINLHSPSFCSRSLASDKGETAIVPFSFCLFRSFKITACHSGERTSPDRRQRLSQTCSSSWTFSSTDIVLSGNSIGTAFPPCPILADCTRHSKCRRTFKAERRRSAARDLGPSIRTDFIASPLHLLVISALATLMDRGPRT